MEIGLVIIGAMLGVIGHILKKVVQVREVEPQSHLRLYLQKNPYKTALTVFYAFGAVAGLYMTDTATFYTAMLAGFSANSLSGKSDI